MPRRWSRPRRTARRWCCSCPIPTRTPVALQLRALDYADPAPRRISLRPGERQTVRIEVAQADHWYDLELTEPGGAFRRRLAGHLETGRPSRSDPAIGRVS